MHFIALPVDDPTVIGAIEQARSSVPPDFVARLAPHITLVPPFNPDRDIEPIVREIAGQTMGLLLDMGGTSHFASVAAVVIAIKPSAELKKLRASLIQALNVRPDYPRFRPHITIAKRLPHLDARRLTAELANDFTGGQIQIANVNLYARSGDEAWQIAGTFPLLS